MYLREVQYKDDSNLASRANLHAKYGTATIGWFEWLVEQVDWPADALVLEVGCGPGWLWEVLHSLIRLVLSDLSVGMATAASARAGAPATVADVQRLPFADETFDVVVANHMLYHVPDIPAAVGELRRVLRPGGALLAATNGVESMREIAELRGAGSEFPKRFGRENGAAVLGEAFTDVTWHHYDDELRCTDADDVVAYIASMEPGELTAGERAELRHRIEQRMVDGVFRVTKDTGAFVARNNAQP